MRFDEATHGRFPFGQPNLPRPMRVPRGAARALVVGVYPSAFHVAWTAPTDGEAERRRPTIASLAVDVEPVVFWNGSEPDPELLLQQWKAAVNFRDAWGSLEVGNNGPSGSGLAEDTLRPLGLNADDVAFTDAVPWYFVKTGAKSQGDAIQSRFVPFAAQAGAPLGALPERPTPARLVQLASGEVRRASFRAEIIEAGAPLVITLGQEALNAVRSVADNCTGVQTRLEPTATYGSRGELVVDGHQMEILPIVHPGFQRQVTRPEWKECLARWRAAVQGDSAR